MRAATLVAAWLAMSALSACAAGGAVQLPPAYYDKPYPNLRVETHHSSAIGGECRRRHLGNRNVRGRALGCAVFSTDGQHVFCTLILPPGYSDRLFRHEQAHCWGWFHSY